jgi:hypothetical protein
MELLLDGLQSSRSKYVDKCYRSIFNIDTVLVVSFNIAQRSWP